MVISTVGVDTGNMNTGAAIKDIDRTKFGAIYSAWFFDADYNSTAVILKDVAID